MVHRNGKRKDYYAQNDNCPDLPGKSYRRFFVFFIRILFHLSNHPLNTSISLQKFLPGTLVRETAILTLDYTRTGKAIQVKQPANNPPEVSINVPVFTPKKSPGAACPARPLQPWSPRNRAGKPGSVINTYSGQLLISPGDQPCHQSLHQFPHNCTRH